MQRHQITFEKASLKHQAIIFRWLAEPHVQEFWDNSQGHKDDIVNFINGRQEPSNYIGGRYVYWVGLCDAVPFSLIMSIQEYPGEDREPIKSDHLSVTWSTYFFKTKSIIRLILSLLIPMRPIHARDMFMKKRVLILWWREQAFLRDIKLIS